MLRRETRAACMGRRPPTHAKVDGLPHLEAVAKARVIGPGEGNYKIANLLHRPRHTHACSRAGRPSTDHKKPRDGDWGQWRAFCLNSMWACAVGARGEQTKQHCLLVARPTRPRTAATVGGGSGRRLTLLLTHRSLPAGVGRTLLSCPSAHAPLLPTPAPQAGSTTHRLRYTLA